MEESNPGDGSNRFEESPVFSPLAATVEWCSRCLHSGFWPQLNPSWALAAHLLIEWTFIPATRAPLA